MFTAFLKLLVERLESPRNRRLVFIKLLVLKVGRAIVANTLELSLCDGRWIHLVLFKRKFGQTTRLALPFGRDCIKLCGGVNGGRLVVRPILNVALCPSCVL